MKPVFATCVLCIILCYFAFNALAGDQGLARWAKLQKEEKRLNDEIVRISAEKQQVLGRIVRLRPETLDLDYIEELARKKLSYARKDEVIWKVSEE